MKGFKKLVLSALACTLTFSTVACGDKRQEENVNLNELKGTDVVDESVTGSLAIRMWEGGFGDEWVYSVIDAFNEVYPNVQCSLSTTTERMVVMSEIAGANTSYDLYLSENQLGDHSSVLASLDDVYSYKWANEDKSIMEKITPQMSEIYLNHDGHRYGIPTYVGAYVMTYNTDFISKEETPVTTDELMALCTKLKGDGITPIIFSGDSSAGYYSFLYYQLFAQYQGLEEYKAAQHGKIIDENGNVKFNLKATCLDGSLEAVQVLEDMLWYENGNIDKNSTGYSFGDAQVKYLSDEAAAMMYNGSWLMSEMKGLVSNASKFGVFKVPVISAIRKRCTTIENDAELAALVKAIDAGSTSLTGEGYDVNQADFDRIYEARTFCYLGAEGANACILDSSEVNSGLAKLFLRFMYSDKGITAFAASKNGAILPVDTVNYKDLIEATLQIKLDSFYTSCYDILSGTKICNYQNLPIPMTCIAPTANCYENQFGSQSSKSRVRAVDSFNYKKNQYAADNGELYWKSLYNRGLVTAEQYQNKNAD